ncbi:HNH endonuclease [Flavobacterium sp. XS1P27]|uniref:HNH endonuclease n=1 Tax=Flavobacterium sp. XS1P27 TaxID=3401724 RepID=UPI003AAFE88C
MKTVENWPDIINNLIEFTEISNKPESLAYRRFSNFFHWYYFPEQDFFAPSKFIGYKNTNLKNYKGNGDGGTTQKALEKYFQKLPKTGTQFKDLYQNLEKFGKTLNKNISSKTLEGTGGIYIAKMEYSSSKTNIDNLIKITEEDILSLLAEESLSGIEGKKEARLVNVYERIPKLRAKAIQIHGTVCKVCEFDFEKTYGKHGKDFIEVHHLKPLFKLIKPTLINPFKDLTVLCSNCHRMIHRNKNNPLTLESLKKLINNDTTANSRLAK